MTYDDFRFHGNFPARASLRLNTSFSYFVASLLFNFEKYLEKLCKKTKAELCDGYLYY